MNERIQELIKQATILEDNDLFVREVFDREKFAELIIKECADVAQINTPDTEECKYTHLVSEKIKEHFGVEQ